MGKIVISENVSLDGVVEDPAGEEGFRRGGWVGRITDRPQLGKLALDEARDADAFLLGRRSYEWFATKWPSRSGELADRRLRLFPVVLGAGERPRESSRGASPGSASVTRSRGFEIGPTAGSITTRR